MPAPAYSIQWLTWLSIRFTYLNTFEFRGRSRGLRLSGPLRSSF